MFEIRQQTNKQIRELRHSSNIIITLFFFHDTLFTTIRLNFCEIFSHFIVGQASSHTYSQRMAVINSQRTLYIVCERKY